MKENVGVIRPENCQGGNFPWKPVNELAIRANNSSYARAIENVLYRKIIANTGKFREVARLKRYKSTAGNYWQGVAMTYDVNSNARRSALHGDNSRLMGGIAISCISPCTYSLTIVWRPWIQGMIEKDSEMQPRW